MLSWSVPAALVWGELLCGCGGNSTTGQQPSRAAEPEAVQPASAATPAPDCTATGAWRTRKPMSVPATFAATAALPDGRVFVISGFAPYGKPRRLTNAVRVYDPKQDVWAEAPKQHRTNLLRCRRTEARKVRFLPVRLVEGCVLGRAGRKPASSRRPGTPWLSTSRVGRATPPRSATLNRVPIAPGPGEHGDGRLREDAWEVLSSTCLGPRTVRMSLIRRGFRPIVKLGTPCVCPT